MENPIKIDDLGDFSPTTYAKSSTQKSDHGDLYVMAYFLEDGIW